MAVSLQRMVLSHFKSPNKGFSSSSDSSTNGVINDKNPVKVYLEAGKTYFWCLCGLSKNQPFCDGTHETPELNIKQRPVKFEVQESKEYYLCVCKQTNKRPFCDGTHTGPAVQNAISVVEKQQEEK